MVTAKHLMKFILENKRGEHGIAESDFNYVIKFFDSTFKGHLVYEDFMQVILPCDNDQLRAQAAGNAEGAAVKPDEFLSPKLEGELAALLEAEVFFHVKLEHLKRGLSRVSDFNIKALFTVLTEAQNQRPYLDKGTVKRYL